MTILLHKASVIVPIYNAEKHLKRCVQSILNQSYEHFEIILVNDGSTDGSQKICEEYASAHANIKTIYQKNSGVSVARNNGLVMADGEYILFVDADDFLECNFMEMLIYNMQKNKTDICLCGIFYDTEDVTNMSKKYTFPTTIEYLNLNEQRDQINRAFIQSSAGIFSIFNKVFKKALIDKRLITFSADKSHAEDFEFCIKYLQQCDSLTFIHSCLYHYVENKESITNTFHLQQLQHHLDWLLILYENIPAETITKYQKDIYRTTLIEINDYLVRALQNSVNLKYEDINIHENIANMIKNLKLRDVEHKSNKILLFSLKLNTLKIYNFIFTIIRRN